MFSKGFRSDLHSAKGAKDRSISKLVPLRISSFLVSQLFIQSHAIILGIDPVFITKKKRKMAEWIKYGTTLYDLSYSYFFFLLISFVSFLSLSLSLSPFFLFYFLRRKNRSLGRQTQLAHRRLIANKILIRERDCIDSRRKLHRDFHFYSRDSVHICTRIDRRSNS